MSNPQTAEDEIPMLNQLPPEILSAIFLHTRTIRRFQRVLPFQVTLSHVCRHWRQVAIATPRLWSSITLFSPKSIPCVQEWLARSGAAPIDVRIDLYCADKMGNVGTDFINDIRTMLVLEVHRFRNLFIFTYHEANVYHIFRSLEHAEAPLLERLCVHVGVHGSRITLSPFVVTPQNEIEGLRSTFKGGLPRLISVEMEPLRCVPPLTNITTLRLVGVGRGFSLRFENLMEILRIPSNLTSFSFRGHIIEDSWPAHRDRSYIELPKLRHLELSAAGGGGVHFLLSLGTPNLESLSWNCTSDSYHLLHDSGQFPPGTGKYPMLKYLTLERQFLNLSNLTTFMKIFPTPTHIFFSHVIPQRVRKFSDLMWSSLSGWTQLQVIGVRMLSAMYSERFAPEIRGALRVRPSIRKILVDPELLLYLNRTAPDLKDIVELKEINARDFPEYWWTSRQEDTPDRL